MTWLRLDDRFDEHPKVRDLSPGAFRAHIRAMCWAARQETDGALTRGVVRDVATAKQRQELIDAGLWEAAEDGSCVIHDWLKYNPSREQLEAKREATKRRVYASRNRVRSDGCNAVTNTTPGPARPGPDPTSPSGEVEQPPARDYTDADAETVCPLDLVDRARERGVLSDMATALRQPMVSVEAKAREFVGYWTIGAGTGKRRSHWMRRLREDIRKAAERNQLTPPGALAHGVETKHGTMSPAVAAFLAGGST